MSASRTSYDYQAAAQAAQFLTDLMHEPPRKAVLAGTGLGEMANAFETEASIPYTDIPHFPAATVQSHAGRLVAGRLDGQPLIVLQGRFHLYEGYSPLAVTFPIRVLQALGVHTLVLTNASGGLNPGFAAGDIMVIADHLNLTGANPLIGPNDDRWGVRFPDLTAAYTPALQQAALRAAASHGISVQQGVYAGLKGPSLETPAEMRYLRTAGADAVGFSTVMEAIAAVHGGMQVLGLSTITNMCQPDNPLPADVEGIIAVAEAAAPRLGALVAEVLKKNQGNRTVSEAR